MLTRLQMGQVIPHTSYCICWCNIKTFKKCVCSPTTLCDFGIALYIQSKGYNSTSIVSLIKGIYQAEYDSIHKSWATGVWWSGTLERLLRESSTPFSMLLGLSTWETSSFLCKLSRAESWDTLVEVQAELRTSAIVATVQQLWEQNQSWVKELSVMAGIIVGGVSHSVIYWRIPTSKRRSCVQMHGTM